MSEENNGIEMVYNISCPSCNNEIKFSLKIENPTIQWAESVKVINEIKKQVKNKVNEMNIADEEKSAILDWLNDDATVILPKDIEDTLSKISSSSS